MAKIGLLKLSIWAALLPHIAASRLVERFGSKSFRQDLQRCLDVVDQYGQSMPSTIIDALKIAEDHRNELHPGVDPIAMIRALKVRWHSGVVQGASTIEQQFVRVVSQRFERNWRRKFREQMLALALSRHRAKEAIASAYLSIAFYGSKCVGLSGVRSVFGQDLSRVSRSQALALVAQLKYPQPLNPTSEWSSKITRRRKALFSRVPGTANNTLQVTFDPLPTFAVAKAAIASNAPERGR